MLVCACYLSLLFVGITAACGDFYWRDYDGVVPSDAIPAGTGIDNEVYYIGHAYLHGFGILMGTIKKGRREISIPCYGVRRTNKMVKILCAQNHTKYYWSPVSYEKFSDLTKNKCPVLGGWDVKTVHDNGYKLGTCYIGRKRYHDELIIGNIAAYVLERNGYPFMYFPYDGEEHNTTKYEVLMYTETPTANYNGVDTIFNLDVIPVDTS